jgi:hypothetical protein
MAGGNGKVLQRQIESGKPEVLPFTSSLELLPVALQKNSEHYSQQKIWILIFQISDMTSRYTHTTNAIYVRRVMTIMTPIFKKQHYV